MARTEQAPGADPKAKDLAKTIETAQQALTSRRDGRPRRIDLPVRRLHDGSVLHGREEAPPVDSREGGGPTRQPAHRLPALTGVLAGVHLAVSPGSDEIVFTQRAHVGHER